MCQNEQILKSEQKDDSLLCIHWVKVGGKDSQSDNEGVGNLSQHLLLIVDMLLLF